MKPLLTGFVVDAYDMKILPVDLKFKAAEIVTSGLEIFTKLEARNIETVFLISDVKNDIKIKDSKGFETLLSGDRADFETLEFSSSADNDTGKNVTTLYLFQEKLQIMPGNLIIN